MPNMRYIVNLDLSCLVVTLVHLVMSCVIVTIVLIFPLPYNKTLLVKAATIANQFASAFLSGMRR